MKGRKVSSATVKVSKDIGKKEPCIDSQQVAILFAAKCKDLQFTEQCAQAPLKERFDVMVQKNCINGHLRFSEMKARINFAYAIRDVFAMDTGRNIVHLDLSNNLLGDDGCKIVSRAVKHSLSLVTLSLASNVIGNTGMKSLFDDLR